MGVHIFWNEAEFQTFKITPRAVAGSLNSSVLPWKTACLLILKELMLNERSLPLGWGLGRWRILFQAVENSFSKSVVLVTPFAWASECEASFGDDLPCPLPRGLCFELFQLCLTLFHPMLCSAPGSSIHGISQARTLEWAALPLGDLPDPGIEPESLMSPALAGRFFTTEPPGRPTRHIKALTFPLPLSTLFYLKSFWNAIASLYTYLFIFCFSRRAGFCPLFSPSP